MSASTTSNTAELTRAQGALAAKQRARRGEARAVVFDEEARREYLTGFRKRNLLKKEAKAKGAKARARAERLALRREHRRELAARAAQNAREVEGALGGGGDEGGDEGDDGGAGPATAAFENDEQRAVVTVVDVEIQFD